MTRTFAKVFSSIMVLALMPMALQGQPALAGGPISLTTCGSAYPQDFDSLASTGTANTAVPTGWTFSESGTNANTTYRAGTGSDSTGDTYSFGASGSSERAFGGLLSGSLVPSIGAQFTNNTGATVTDLAISYDGEQWRLGQNTVGRAADRLDFQFSTNATSLTTGSWTDADSLDFSSPVIAGTVGALNGNVAPNRTLLSFTITGLNIANGASFWIRWADADLIPGADDGLSVDNFSLTPECNLCANVICPANGPCGTYMCDPGSGKCVGTFQPSTDVCRPAASDCDVAENCSGSSASCPTDGFAEAGALCEDGSFCTSASGTPGESDACNGGGLCVGIAVDCDDSLYCTGTESCDDDLDDCVSSGDPCPDTECNTCQEGKDSCFDPVGTVCGDLDESVCDAADSCDGLGNCLDNFAPDGAPCSDGLFCNGEELCFDGSCSEQTDPCVDQAHCDEDENMCLDCVSDAECADTDPCTVDACEDGQCTYRPGSHCTLGAAIDIKPGSCPNSLDPRLVPISPLLPAIPVAILGSQSINAADIDSSSIRMLRSDRVGGAAAPNSRPALEDVAGPAQGDPCQCVSFLNRDGLADLVVQFSIARLNSEMRLQAERPGTRIGLILEGKLRDGTPFQAKDCIVIVRGQLPFSGRDRAGGGAIDK